MAIKLNPETLVTRTYLDDKRENRPLSAPLLQGTTFSAASAEEHAKLYQTGQPTFYQRFGHPGSMAVAEKIAALEKAEGAIAFSSGMAAISSAIMAYAEPGKKIIVSNQCFEQTERFLKHLEKVFGLDVVFIDTTNLSNVDQEVTRETCLIYLETPSNPHLRVSDIQGISKIAWGENETPVFVDSTFATPFGQNPLELGASLVIHSGTKFINGHHDVMCGFVAGSKKFLEPIKEMQVLMGGILDPHASWLVARGLKTFGIRMERVGENALKIAQFIKASSQAEDVRYPLLEGSPGYAIAKRQMRHGGGVVSFRIKAGNLAARKFINSLELIHIASSLGGIETTIEIPYDLDWFKQVETGKQKNEFADPGMIRLAVGIEDPIDLIADIKQGLAEIA